MAASETRHDALPSSWRWYQGSSEATARRVGTASDLLVRVAPEGSQGMARRARLTLGLSTQRSSLTCCACAPSQEHWSLWSHVFAGKQLPSTSSIYVVRSGAPLPWAQRPRGSFVLMGSSAQIQKIWQARRARTP